MTHEVKALVDRRWAEYGISFDTAAENGRIRQSSGPLRAIVTSLTHGTGRGLNPLVVTQRGGSVTEPQHGDRPHSRARLSIRSDSPPGSRFSSSA